MDKSLEEITEAAILKDLGKIATERFTCGGALPSPPRVQLNYLNKTGLWCGATLPGLQDAHLQQILESCTIDSFGKGEESVTDKSYHDAYALDVDKFTCSFELCQTEILREIQALLAPDFPSIRAEKYKLNVYTSPAGCFKAHVDTTPRGDNNMFGSLVVCLPTQFSGGGLVTRHHGKQVTYNWSSPANDPIQNIQWAAFFSDVEHEVFPVTEGCQVTLTYNLYHCDKRCPVSDITTSPFYNQLKAALDYPHFLREGGVLGFACQHAYTFKEDQITQYGRFKLAEDPSMLLKGSDRTVLAAAKALGLKACVRPVVEVEEKTRKGQVVKNQKKIFPEFEYNSVGYLRILQSWVENFEDKEDGSHIKWCQDLIYDQPAISAIDHTLDYPEVDTCYLAAAIIVDVPSRHSRKRLQETEGVE